MSDNEACCTCAALLSSIPPTYDEKTEKPAAHERRLDCCGRAICARCTTDNPRFRTYCPFCQVSSEPTPLPQGLREPPPYSPPDERCDSMSSSTFSDLPSYSSIVPDAARPPEKSVQAEQSGQDVLHFIDPVNDTVRSLALRYGVPADALRRKNGIWQDHLLAGRKAILIPGEFYKGGVSLSPRPIEGEEEELRKSKIRKFMVTCKVHDVAPMFRYDVAELYLKQAEYDLELAIEAFKEDEEWVQKNPLQKGKQPKIRSRTPRFATGLAAQLG